MNLTFKRKLSKSFGNKAAVITVLRAIAQSWEQYESLDLIFDGNCLMIKPMQMKSFEYEQKKVNEGMI